MKTVSGKIVSTKPVNLSKAATILSNFVTTENGASQSVSTYLRRASEAFNELVYFKKHHKLKKKVTKDDGLTKSDVTERNLENGLVNRKFDHSEVKIEENGTGNVEGESIKKEEKKKKKKIRDGSLGSEKNDNVEAVIEEDNVNVKEEKSDEKKRKKKKRKNEEADGGEVGNLVTTPERKKKRMKTEAADE